MFLFARGCGTGGGALFSPFYRILFSAGRELGLVCRHNEVHGKANNVIEERAAACAGLRLSSCNENKKKSDKKVFHGISPNFPEIYSVCLEISMGRARFLSRILQNLF